MKIILMKRDDWINRRNSYLILGDWNLPSDVNTVIDPGNDAFVLQEIEKYSSGFNKLVITQVVLTHTAGKHVGGAMMLKERFNARIMAFGDGAGINEQLSDGQIIKAGDDILEVLHTPGHSPDSICLYAPAEKTLFSGNTDLLSRGLIKACADNNADVLLKIACRDILKIYSCHEEAITHDCQDLIIQAMRNQSWNRVNN